MTVKPLRVMPRGLVGIALALTLVFSAEARAEKPPIIIGMDADMSSGTAQGGEAIRRGALVAIDEINGKGGVLGRPFKLVVRDHRGIPVRGKDNILEFAAMDDLVAIIGGVHTPVAMAELDLIHEHKIIYLGPWAAGTPVVDNGKNPNYVFRVSVRDQFAGEFLLRMALKRGFKSPGLLLERTGWGRSNHKAFTAAAARHDTNIAGTQWFNWGVKSLRTQISTLSTEGADVIILVANPREGALAVKTVAREPKGKRLPIISHWGITGGNFPDKVGAPLHDVDLSFLQTYSFMRPTFPDRTDRFLRVYARLFAPAKSARDITSPVGSAHAYDLVHMLAKAIKKAGKTDRAAVRTAMESGLEHKGLVRDYSPAFAPDRHDALNRNDFTIARFDRRGVIVPLSE